MAAEDAVGELDEIRSLRRRLRQQVLVAELGRQALAGAPVSELVVAAIDVVRKVLDAPFSGALELLPNGNLRLCAALGWPADFVGLEVPPGPDSQAGYTLASGEEVLSRDAQHDERFRMHPRLAEAGVHGGVSVVVGSASGVWGVLAAHSTKIDAFSTDDAAQLSIIANVLGAALARAADEEELRITEQRRRLALEAGRMGTWEWNLTSGRVTWDANLEAIFGFEAGTFAGTMDSYMERIHPDDRDATVHSIQRSLENRSNHAVEHRVVWPDGSVRWVDGRGKVELGSDGAVTGMIGVAWDITDRRRAEEERDALHRKEQEALATARVARERLRFLADATDLLHRSLDVDETLQELGRLAISRLADWCAIDLLDETGEIQFAVVAHADPEMVATAKRLRERWPTDPDAETGIPRVIRTGEPELIVRMPLERLTAAAQDPEHLATLVALNLRSVMIVPLTGRDGVLGALTLVTSDSEREFGEDDLELAEELGRRAAIAVENARLFADRDHVAKVLQASLIPPGKPTIPGLDLDTRYQPGGDGRTIGGDFYDLFESADGAWSIVIGDVCGKGADAAALTGLTRHTVRAAAMRERSPAQVLRMLNEALFRNETTQRFCTVAYARLVKTEAGFEMTTACGGHPPPLIVRSDGSVEATPCHGTLLGVFADVDLSDEIVTLHPGDVVVFYTDGVTEARRGGRIFGDDGLLALLAACGPCEPVVLVDSIVEAIVDPPLQRTRDDVAIIAIRVGDDGEPTAAVSAGVLAADA